MRASRINNFSKLKVISQKQFVPNPKQKQYLKHLDNNDIPVVLGVGPAGTGKTLLACKVGVEKLLNKNIEKLVITRPTVSVGEHLGYLPGSLEEKMYPWLIPLYDSFNESITYKSLQKFIHDQTIEICPLSYIRGRTFNNAFIIADEMQNSSEMEMKTLLTRIGKNSKIVLTGDLAQSDLKEKNGLEDFLNKIENKRDDDFLQIITFDMDDVERSEVVKYLLNLYI